MKITRILKNKWLWVAVVFVFIGYQLMDDFLSYDYTRERVHNEYNFWIRWSQANQ